MVYLDTWELADGFWLTELRFDVTFITEFIAVIIGVYAQLLPIKAALIGLLKSAFKQRRED